MCGCWVLIRLYSACFYSRLRGGLGRVGWHRAQSCMRSSWLLAAWLAIVAFIAGRFPIAASLRECGRP